MENKKFNSDKKGWLLAVDYLRSKGKWPVTGDLEEVVAKANDLFEGKDVQVAEIKQVAAPEPVSTSPARPIISGKKHPKDEVKEKPAKKG
jgi:hypothetical protein